MTNLYDRWLPGPGVSLLESLRLPPSPAAPLPLPLPALPQPAVAAPAGSPGQLSTAHRLAAPGKRFVPTNQN